MITDGTTKTLIALRQAMAVVQTEHEKFAASGNQSAATRARVASSEASKLLKVFRKQSLEETSKTGKKK